MGIQKLIQVSMDGPNVNLKFYRLLKDKVEDVCSLIDFGSCSLHVIHGALQYGHKVTGWSVNSFLVGIYWLFKDAPSRRSDFKGKLNINFIFIILSFLSFRCN